MIEKPEASMTPETNLLDQASKRGITALMPYLWTVVFIITILALTYKRGLDWWTTGFGALVTVSLLIVLFVIRQIVGAPRKEVRYLANTAMWIVLALFAISLTLLVSSAFFGWPLPLRPSESATEDEGTIVIRQFYKLIDKRDFEAAWNLIHKKRKDEIRAKNPRFDWEDFAKAYLSTREHSHLQIEKVQSPSAIDRAYRVSCAVRDELPINHLYHSRVKLVKEWFEGGSLDREKLIGIVVNDVKAQFEVPKELESIVVKFIENRRFESLFKPEIILDIGRELKLTERKDILASRDSVWRYFVLEVHLQEEQPGSWKISSGFIPRLIEATYEPGASAP